MDISIRPINNTDSLEALTDLLHLGYKKLADLGFRSLATHQDVATTKRRIAGRVCYIAFHGQQMIGTICYRPPFAEPRTDGGHPWFNQPFIAMFGQFTVHPQFQKQGLGGRLIEVVEQAAINDKAVEIALDTIENMHELRSYYEKRGYRLVGNAKWKEVNYDSVILSKKL